jgi:hypothetical protein
MKKFLAMLLCLCMLLPCAVAESTEAEAWLEEKSLALAALVNEAIHSDAYISLMLGNTQNIPADLRKTDFSAPTSVKIHIDPLPSMTAYSLMTESAAKEFQFSPALNDYLLRRMKASLPTLLVSKEGMEMVVANSIFTFSDAWLCPDFITSDAHVFLEYEGDYVLWVEFSVSDLGTVSGQTHLLPKARYEQMDKLILELLQQTLPQ